MARSLWSGSLSFGLVNVPVALVSAVRDLDLHFRQLHDKDAAPIEVQRWCSKEDVEVPFEEITHSYECEDGTEVLVNNSVSGVVGSGPLPGICGQPHIFRDGLVQHDLFRFPAVAGRRHVAALFVHRIQELAVAHEGLGVLLRDLVFLHGAVQAWPGPQAVRWIQAVLKRPLSGT